MKLHDLKPAPGSHTARTRVGRGIAAGKGKTAGRGTKGQKARDGELATALFVVADAFTKTAVAKIEGAGGTISILEIPTEELVALGTDGSPRGAREPRTAAGRLAAGKRADARATRATVAAEKASGAEAASTAKAARPPKASKSQATAEVADRQAAEAPVDATDDAGFAGDVDATMVADSSVADSSVGADAAGDIDAAAGTD